VLNRENLQDLAMSLDQQLIVSREATKPDLLRLMVLIARRRDKPLCSRPLPDMAVV